MTQIALFHSVLGVRPGIHDAATRLRAAGHDVLAVDQYDGRMFDSYEEADGFAQSLGYPELMSRAVAAVEALPDGFIAAGFSNGGGMSEYIATERRVGGVLMLSGALPLEMLGGDHWPAGVPAQIHYTTGDSFRRQDWVDTVASSIRAADATVELFDYPATGTCSPTHPCPPSTSPTKRTCSGSACSPSRPSPKTRRDRHRPQRRDRGPSSGLTCPLHGGPCSVPGEVRRPNADRRRGLPQGEPRVTRRRVPEGIGYW